MKPMFIYSSNETVIPSLVFTKAELVYALSVLMAEIPPNDNATRIEMVELRHYLNLIRDKVVQAASDGTLERAVAAPEPRQGNDTPSPAKAAPAPSMDELRQEFPNLSDEEIEEVLAKAIRERNIAEAKKKEEEQVRNPLPPSFIAKPAGKPVKLMTEPLTKKQIADRDNSKRFASLLGAS